MIYLFAGDDTERKIAGYEKFMKSIASEMEVFFVNKSNFSKPQIENFCGGSGLFFSKCAVVCSNVFENEDMRDFILEKLPVMGESGNLFIFSEGRLPKATLDEFKKSRAELNILETPKEKKEKFNNFLLADAFGRRNKLELWTAFRQALLAGVEMEALVGVLFWKAKDMLTKKNFGQFSETELKNFASQISYLLPEARRKGLDDEAAFEQFLLEAF